MKAKVIVIAEVRHTLEVEVPDGLDEDEVIGEAEDLAWSYRLGKGCCEDCESESGGKVRIVKTEELEWEHLECFGEVEGSEVDAEEA